MAVTNIQRLYRLEAKIEATRGTAETTMTRAIIFPDGGASWTYDQQLEVVPETFRGYHATVDSQLGISMCKLNLEFIATYEELVWWLNLAVLGSNLTGTTTGSTPAGYTYTFTPTLATDDLASATFKIGCASGIYKLDRGMVNSITIRGNPGQGGEATIRVSVELVCRFVGTSSFDSPSAVTRTKILARGVIASIDASGGTIGTTAKSGYIRSWSVTVNNNLEEKQYIENTTSLSTDVARGEQVWTGEWVTEHKDDTEFAFARAGTIRLIQLLYTGASIGTSPTTNYFLKIQFPNAKYLPSLAPTWQGQNLVATMQWIGERTAAVTNPGSIIIVNASSSITA